MGLFDSILGKVSGHADIDNLAAKLGISPDVVEKTIAALAKAHYGEGDPVAKASTEVGVEPTIVARILEQIGGAGSLSEYASLIK